MPHDLLNDDPWLAGRRSARNGRYTSQIPVSRECGSKCLNQSISRVACKFAQSSAAGVKPTQVAAYNNARILFMRPVEDLTLHVDALLSAMESDRKSALVAILCREPERERFVRSMAAGSEGPPLISQAVTHIEPFRPFALVAHRHPRSSRCAHATAPYVRSVSIPSTSGSYRD